MIFDDMLDAFQDIACCQDARVQDRREPHDLDGLHLVAQRDFCLAVYTSADHDRKLRHGLWHGMLLPAGNFPGHERGGVAPGRPKT